MEKIPESNMPPDDSRDATVSRVLGVDADEEKDILDYFKLKFEANKVGPFDKEHPEELDRLIPIINDQMKDFLGEYEVDGIDIPPGVIHIIDKSKLASEQLQKLQGYERVLGFYAAEQQGIGIMRDYEDGKLVFMQTLVHEMFHLNSFQAFQRTEPGERDEPRTVNLIRNTGESDEEELSLALKRIGFRVYLPTGESIFANIDESVIQELTMRFDWRYFHQIPQLAKEIQERDEAITALSQKEDKSIEDVRTHIANIDFKQHKDEQSEMGYTVDLKGYSYNQEREDFNSLADDLFAKNKIDFSSREDVFNLFVRGVMRGDLAPIAKLIEKTYGSGSFKLLAQKTAKKPK